MLSLDACICFVGQVQTKPSLLCNVVLSQMASFKGLLYSFAPKPYKDIESISNIKLKDPFICYFELKLLFLYFARVLGYIIKFVRLFFFSRSTTRINVNIVSKEKTASQYTLLYTYLSSCYVPLFSPFQNCSFRLNEIPFLPTIVYSLDEKYSSNSKDMNL